MSITKPESIRLGSLIEFVPSGVRFSNVQVPNPGPGVWYCTDLQGETITIKPGQKAIILEEKEEFDSIENDWYFSYKILLDGVVLLDVGDNMFKTISIAP